jgi:hypothetical protein
MGWQVFYSVIRIELMIGCIQGFVDAAPDDQVWIDRPTTGSSGEIAVVKATESRRPEL